jgi:hypothetical protein
VLRWTYLSFVRPQIAHTSGSWSYPAGSIRAPAPVMDRCKQRRWMLPTRQCTHTSLFFWLNHLFIPMRACVSRSSERFSYDGMYVPTRPIMLCCGDRACFLVSVILLELARVDPRWCCCSTLWAAVTMCVFLLSCGALCQPQYSVLPAMASCPPTSPFIASSRAAFPSLYCPALDCLLLLADKPKRANTRLSNMFSHCHRDS